VVKNLPKLEPTNIVDGRYQRMHLLPKTKDRAKLRSKTYLGIANALAVQFVAFVESNYDLKDWDKLHVLDKKRIFALYV
jgi:hypothetical protein